MSFLNPFFLLGLAAISVPVVIHLINLRKPEKLPFSTLAFFEVLQKSTIRRIRIKRYLLLFLRIAAISMLALALARPFIPPSLLSSSASDEPQLVGIILDNSPSMSQIDENGPFFEQAKEVALSLVENARETDRFIIQRTNGEPLFSQPLSATRAAEVIREQKVLNQGNYTRSRLSESRAVINDSEFKRATIYVVTDGQQSQLSGLLEEQASSDEHDTIIPVQLVKVGQVNQRNVAVTDISLKSQMVSTGNPLTLEVSVKNFGDAPVSNQFVSLEVADNLVGQYQMQLTAGETRSYVFELVPEQVGNLKGTIQIDGDDVTFDNTTYFSITVPEQREIIYVSVDEGSSGNYSSYLEPALEAATMTNGQLNMQTTTVNQLSRLSWQQSDALVLDGLRSIPEYLFSDLQRYVQNGNGIVFLPSEKGDVRNYNSFLELFNAGRFEGVDGEYGNFTSIATLGELVQGHPILDDIFEKKESDEIKVDKPDIYYSYQFTMNQGARSFPVLRSSTGGVLLGEQQFGDGKLMVSSLGVDPGWSNFPVNPLFAPVYYRTVLFAAATEQGGLQQHILGKPFRWTGELPSSEVRLIKDSVQVKPQVDELSTGTRVSYPANEWEPGWVTIRSGEEQKTIAVNQHIMESDLSALTKKELENKLNKTLHISTVIDATEYTERQLRNELHAAGFGKEIWQWFIWIALMLLITETVISKWYRAETNR